ncbi:MAG: Copper transport outer membrane protein MctB, partial [Actinomycetota bacterium]
DHIQTPPGRVTAILALSDFGRGVIGDYGSDDSADRAAPAAA